MVPSMQKLLVLAVVMVTLVAVVQPCKKDKDKRGGYRATIDWIWPPPSPSPPVIPPVSPDSDGNGSDEIDDDSHSNDGGYGHFRMGLPF